MNTETVSNPAAQSEKKWRKLVRITVAEVYREPFVDRLDMNKTLVSPQTHTQEVAFDLGSLRLEDALNEVNLLELAEALEEAQKILTHVASHDPYSGTNLAGRIGRVIQNLQPYRYEASK